MLIHALKQKLSGHSSLLDIGAGVGIIQHELLNEEITRITNVDASSGYLKIAEEEAAKAGFSDRVRYLAGDFIEQANEVALHTVVTLDKVICCYPDAESLLDLSVQRSDAIVGIVYPRDNSANRFFQVLGRIFFRAIGNPFRFFIHSDKSVEEITAKHGFKTVVHEFTWLWQIRVFEKQPHNI